MTRVHSDAAICVDAVIEQVGKRIVLGLPLGLGKAIHIANAFYARAAQDPSIDLHIFTALTLEKHVQGPKLLRNFAGPIVERLFGGYPDPLYAKAVRDGTLPPNIVVSEFYLLAGQWLGSAGAQRSYVSANYAEVPRLLLDLGINVIGQLVAKSDDGDAFSLSCNPDITLDILPELESRRAQGKPFALVGEVNDELPFMTGDAALPAAKFDHLLDAPNLRYPLFAPPKEAVGLGHHAIGLRIAALVRDGGTLQIGIGALADALACALILRQKNNAAFREVAGQLGIAGEMAPFEAGLYGVSEMFVDVFINLYRAGLLKRRAPDGALLHGAFFVGPKAFYRALREMPESERALFQMKAISFTNQIRGPDEAERRAMRKDACFVNEGMVATLLGEVASDTLDDARVVSGVGGQYNFVAQAHALPEARSIIAINATRTSKGRTTSNITWSAKHATIPRHLRDIVVTEYGIADLRGKSDRDCIVAMIAIADSAFQPALLQQAKASGKIESRYELPALHTNNRSGRLAELLKPAISAGHLASYPFGTDLDSMEQRIAEALDRLKTANNGSLGLTAKAIISMFVGNPPSFDAEIARLGLARPGSAIEWITARLVRLELNRFDAERRARAVHGLPGSPSTS